MFNEDQILNLNSKEDLKKINYRTRKVIFSDNFLTNFCSKTVSA